MKARHLELVACICFLKASLCLGAEPISLKGHEKSVTTLVWSADGKSVFSAGDDRTIRTWDASSGKQTKLLQEIAPEGYGGPVIAFSPDLKSAAINFWGDVTIRSLADGKKIIGFDPILDRGEKFAFRPDVYAMAFSPDGKLIATAGSTAAVGGSHGLPGGIVAIWDRATGKLAHKFPRLSTSANTVIWSGDGKLLAVGTNGAGGELPAAGEITVWNMSSGQIDHNFSAKPSVEQGEWASIGDMAFSPDNRHMAASITAGGRGRPAGLIIEESGAFIKVWDLEKVKATIPIKGLKASVNRVTYSPDGKLLAAAGTDKVLRIWNIATGKEVSAHPCPARVSIVAFSPKGDSIAAGCTDGSIRVWWVPAAK